MSDRVKLICATEFDGKCYMCVCCGCCKRCSPLMETYFPNQLATVAPARKKYSAWRPPLLEILRVRLICPCRWNAIKMTNRSHSGHNSNTYCAQVLLQKFTALIGVNKSVFYFPITHSPQCALVRAATQNQTLGDECVLKIFSVIFSCIQFVHSLYFRPLFLNFFSTI